jgi:hypothetical protein
MTEGECRVARGDYLRRRSGGRVDIVDIAGAGHALLPEQPERIATAVLAALK